MSAALALAVLALALLAAPCCAARAEAVRESVDASRSPLNRVKVSIEGADAELMARLAAPGALDRACALVAPAHALACTHAVAGDRATLEFTTVEPLLAVAGTYELGLPRPLVRFSYTPLSFLVLDEAEEVGERTVQYDLPGTGLAVGRLRSKERVTLEFPIQCPDGGAGCMRQAGLSTDLDEYRAGEVVALDAGGEVELAAWGLFADDGSPLSRPRACFNCTELLLPLDPAGMGCSEHEGGQCPAMNATVHALFRPRAAEGLVNATARILVRPALFPVTLAVGDGAGRISSSFILGETMVVGAFSGVGTAACAVELVREGKVVASLPGLPSCLQVPLATSTEWPEGEYVLRVAVFNRAGLSASASALLTLLAPGRAVPLPVALEQPSYMVGEDVALVASTPGERCEVALLRHTGREAEVLSTRSGPCGRISFPLPETVTPGRYQLRVTAYRGDERGVHTVPLEVEPWVPQGQRGTDFSRLCRGGALAAGDAAIRCMGPQARCEPASDRFPMCACFSEEGALAAVCGPGQRCEGGGCAGGGGGRPFVLAEEDGRRVARVGAQRMSAILPWELCPTTCLCTDEEASFGHVCGPGEMCRRDGCSVPALTLRVLAIRPEAVRMDALASGDAVLTLELEARLRGRPVAEGLSTGSLTLTAGDLALPPDAASLDWTGSAWRLRSRLPSHLSGSLSPGSLPLWVVLRHAGEEAAARASVPLWHGELEAGYEVSFASLEPSTVALEDTADGALVQAYLSVVDARDGRPVAALTRDDVAATVRGKQAQVFSLRDAPLLRQWVATLVVPGGLAPGRAPVEVTVSRLGRAGRAVGHLTLVAPGETRIVVEDVRPGSRGEPVYQVLQAWGFDMDVVVSVSGRNVVPEAKRVTAWLGGARREALYVASTPEGYRVHLPPFRFCGRGLDGWQELTLSFLVERGGLASEHNATGQVLFAPNPGDWVLPRECALR